MMKSLPMRIIASDLVRSLLPRGFDRRLKLLSFVIFMNDFGRTLVTVYLPLYYLQLGASPLLIGIGITISTGCSALFQAVGGVLADIWGRKKSMVLSMAARSVFLIILGLSATIGPSFVTILLLFALSEATNGIFLTATNAMISDLVEEKRAAEGFGIYRVAINLGFTLGSLAGGLIALYTFSIYIMTALVLLNLGITTVYLGETWSTGKRSLKLGGMLSVSKNRILLAFSIVSIGAGLLANQMGPTFALYTTQEVHISKQFLGYLYFLNGILVILFQYAFSLLGLRYRLTSLVAISVGVQSLSYLLVGFSQDLLILQVVIVGLTIGEMLQAPSGTAFANRLAPYDKRGEYIGFYNWCWNSGQALSPVVGGLLLSIFATAEYLTWYVTFAIGSLCFTAYLAIGFFIRKSEGQRSTEHYEVAATID